MALYHHTYCSDCLVEYFTILNPLVKIFGLTCNHLNIDFKQNYDLILISSMNRSSVELLKINEKARNDNVISLMAENFGFKSFIFSDLLHYSFTTTLSSSFDSSSSPFKAKASSPTKPSNGPSPGAQGVKRKAEETTTSKELVENLQFPALKSVLGHRFKTVKKWAKTMHPLFFILSIIWEFKSIHGRFPTDGKHDIDLLGTIKLSVLERFP